MFLKLTKKGEGFKNTNMTKRRRANNNIMVGWNIWNHKIPITHLRFKTINSHIFALATISNIHTKSISKMGIIIYTEIIFMGNIIAVIRVHRTKMAPYLLRNKNVISWIKSGTSKTDENNFVPFVWVCVLILTKERHESNRTTRKRRNDTCVNSWRNLVTVEEKFDKII